MLKEVIELLDKNNNDTPVYVHTGYIDKKDETSEEKDMESK